MPRLTFDDSSNDIYIKSDFVGHDGALVYNRSDKALEITMHGAIFNANHMSGMQLSDNISSAIEKSEYRSIVSWEDIKEVRLFCCVGGFGGVFSIASIVASRLGKPVRAYTSKYSSPGSRKGYDNKVAYFEPHERKVFVEGVHKILHFTSEHVFLPANRVRNALRR